MGELDTQTYPPLMVEVNAEPILGSKANPARRILNYADLAVLYELQEHRTQHILKVSQGLRTPLTTSLGHTQTQLRTTEGAGLEGRQVDGVSTILVRAQRANLVDLTEMEQGPSMVLANPNGLEEIVPTVWATRSGTPRLPRRRP